MKSSVDVVEMKTVRTKKFQNAMQLNSAELQQRLGSATVVSVTLSMVVLAWNLKAV